MRICKEGKALTGGAPEAVVVQYRQRTILQQVDVQLHTVAALHSPTEGLQGVFRRTIAVESPVGIPPATERCQPGMTPTAAGSQRVQPSHRRNGK